VADLLARFIAGRRGETRWELSEPPSGLPVELPDERSILPRLIERGRVAFGAVDLCEKVGTEGMG